MKKRRQIDRAKNTTRETPVPKFNSENSCTMAIVDKKKKKRSTTISLFFPLSSSPLHFDSLSRYKKWWHTISFIHHAWRQKETKDNRANKKYKEASNRNRWWDGDWIISSFGQKKGEKKHKLDEKGGRIKHDSLSHITSMVDEYFAGSLVTVICNTIGVQELDTEQQRLAEMPDDIPPPRNQVVIKRYDSFSLHESNVNKTRRNKTKKRKTVLASQRIEPLRNGFFKQD